MKKQSIDTLAELLRNQRKHYLQDFRTAEAGLDALAEERESELEEHAQEEQSALFLLRHDEKTLQAIKEIDAALQRILDGSYGKCAGCYKSISPARLQSLPASRFCRACAARNEHRPTTTAFDFKNPAEGPVPAELNLLNDRELTDTTVEHLKDDGRIDMQELHIVCRKGVVHLSGKVPSEAEHQILLHTLTDVLGLQEIVDQLDVEALLWQTARRAKEPVPEPALQRWEDLPGSEDIVESTEEDKEFVAPAKPTPDG
jgi:DnaK suppressor protein